MIYYIEIDSLEENCDRTYLFDLINDVFDGDELEKTEEKNKD
jgi:hypothetical protein